MISNPEGPAVAADSDTSATNANIAPRKPRVATAKARFTKKIASARRRVKSQKGGKSAKRAAPRRKSSKSAKILELLKRSGGATLQELMKATGWQAHSVRGFLSGTVGKKMGLTVNSSKAEGEERRYSVEA